MGKVRDKMLSDMQLKGLSEATIKNYLLYARMFVKYHGRPPEEMGGAEIREFLLYLKNERKLAAATSNQARAAVCFLYRTTLKRAEEVDDIPTRKLPKRLPQILSRQDVEKLLNQIRKPHYRLFFMLLYGCGLRIREACRLRWKDIDIKQRFLIVRNGKGAKDRVCPIGKRLLTELKVHRTIRSDTHWVFPGKTRAGHISPDMPQRVFRLVASEVGMSQRATPHVLRHCFATHLLESGASLTVVKELLGHACIDSTMKYAHLSMQAVRATQSPLDALCVSNTAKPKTKEA